jgi:hypothetical protein
MDLSKLPKLSKTEAPAAAEETPVALPTPRAVIPDAQGIGGDVWFNTVIGLLLLYLGRTFFVYMMSRLTGKPFHTGIVWTDDQHNGAEVPYPELQGFQMLSDAGPFLFGVAVLIEAAVKAFFGLGWRIPKFLIQIALLLAIISTGFNLYVSAKLMSISTLPLISGLAVAFGGYIIIDLYRILRITRNMPAK